MSQDDTETAHDVVTNCEKKRVQVDSTLLILAAVDVLG